MRKLLVFVFLTFFTVTFSFASGQRDSFEIGIGYHRISESQTVSGIDVTTVMPSFAIHYAGVTLITDTVGIGAYGNFLIPQELRMTAMGQTVTANRSDYDFLFGMDFLIGPTFTLYRSDTINIPLSVGIHFLHLWANTEVGNSSGSAIGLGSNITGEYHFNERIYIFGRFQFSLNFYSWGRTQVYTGFGTVSQSYSESMITWGINPSFGIAFKF